VAFLVDTNVLVYRYDPRFPSQQRQATDLLREGLNSGEAYLPHQALVEFIAATTRRGPDGGPSLLSATEALHEAEEFLGLFPVLFPVPGLFRLAVRGAATYGLPWFDAHLWAYAEFYALPVLYSEDFQHDRLYGTVRVINPFR
jgi:predicted nucleic acid-binding protein